MSIDGEDTTLVEPDNPEALAAAIRKVLDNPDLAQRISEQAYRDVQNYTWQRRAQRILQFIQDIKDAD